MASESLHQPPETSSNDPLTDVGTLRKLNELHDLAQKGSWQRAREILDTLPALTEDIIGVHYEIACLSFGAGNRALGFVKELINYLPDMSITKANEYGFTLLHIAAAVGNKEAALHLVDRMPHLIYAIDCNGNYPVHRAAKFAHKVVLEYLMNETIWKRDGSVYEDGQERGKLVLLFIDIIEAQFFDIARHLVLKYPFVATTKAGEGNTTALYHLAKMNLMFHKKHMVNPRSLKSMLFWSCPLLEEVLYGIEGEPNHLARELVRSMCDAMKSLSLHESKDIYKDAILEASSSGNIVVVKLILEAFPQAIGIQSNSRQSILHLVIKNRRTSVFNFIFQSGGYRNINVDMQDNEGNNVLHLAATLPPLHILNQASGPAIQMQREAQWYTAVSGLVMPHCKLEENSDGKTPGMIFAEQHSELMSDAESWMKGIANSCCVVAVLIITIMFNATITVPGGIITGKGFPTFKSDGAFIIFAVGDSISLFTSTFSLLIFLSTYTSGYLADSILPSSILVYGLVTLFISITSMMLAFIAAIYLVMGRKSSAAVIPTAIVGGLAVLWFWVNHIPVLGQLLLLNKRSTIWDIGTLLREQE